MRFGFGICEVFVFLFLFGRSLTVGLLRYKRGTRAFRSESADSESLSGLTIPNARGYEVENVATFSSFYLIYLSVAIEVFPSANVLNLANFTSPNAVLIGYVAGKPNTKIADSQYRASFHFARLFSSLFWLRLKKALS